jgi:glycosyltransferase involved in cell wall biosynthesis
MTAISTVVPLYNEEENVVESYREIKLVLDQMVAEGTIATYEMIFVDDGSKDRTIENLKAIGGDDSQLKIVEFRRNFGQTAAMAAGFEMTRFPVVVALDGDLQNDPREIPKMVEVLNQGYDLVAGWRKDRKDKFLSRRVPSMLANRLISRATGVALHDYGCTLKVMRSEVAKGIRLYGEMHRFIPALANEMGARITEVPVNHRERKFGTSKYGISRTLRVILDLMTVKFLLGYSKRPIHLFGAFGLATFICGSLTLSWIVFQRLFLSVPLGNRPLLMLSVLLVLVGIQFFVFGLLAEMLARTYYESQSKRTYVIREVHEGRASSEKEVKPLVALSRAHER